MAGGAPRPSRALELAIAELEGGFACKLHPSGLSAATTTLLTFLKPGDHLLMTDAVYRPVRDLLRRHPAAARRHDHLL